MDTNSPNVDPRIFVCSHHGVGLASTRLSVRHQADIVAVDRAGDDGECVLKYLQREMPTRPHKSNWIEEQKINIIYR